MATQDIFGQTPGANYRSATAIKLWTALKRPSHTAAGARRQLDLQSSSRHSLWKIREEEAAFKAATAFSPYTSLDVPEQTGPTSPANSAALSERMTRRHPPGEHMYCCWARRQSRTSTWSAARHRQASCGSLLRCKRMKTAHWTRLWRYWDCPRHNALLNRIPRS